MDQSLLIWLFAGAFGLIGVLFLMSWHHAIKCRGVGEDVAVIKQIVSDIRREIGSHDSGIISQLHLLSKATVKLNAKAGIEE
jgi:hypothetical protein